LAAYGLDAPCGVPSTTAADAQYAFLAPAGMWDCFPGETFHRIAPGFRAPCVCQVICSLRLGRVIAVVPRARTDFLDKDSVE